MPKQASLLCVATLATLVLSTGAYSHPGHEELEGTVSGFWHVLTGADHIFLFVLTGMATALFVSSEKVAGVLSVVAIIGAAIWGNRHLNFVDVTVVADAFVMEFVLISAGLWALGYFGVKAIQQNIAEGEKRAEAQRDASVE